MRKLLWLALLLTAVAGAAPWQTLTPSGEKFACRMPPGKIKETKAAAAYHWLLLKKGEYALQVVSIAQGGSDSRVEFYLSTLLKASKIKESKRTPVKGKGFSGLEVSGTMPSQPKGKLVVRIRVLASPDHLYSLSAFIPDEGNAKVIDPFFKSFKLK